MHCVDNRIFEQLLKISSGAIDSNAVTELSRSFAARSRDRRYFHARQTAQIFHMHSSHEACPDDRCF